MSVLWSLSISGVGVFICSSRDILLISSSMSFTDGPAGFSAVFAGLLFCCVLIIFERVSVSLVL